MTREEKACWLKDFYAAVETGKGVQCMSVSYGGWVDTPDGPDLLSKVEDWRIKPEPREWYVFIPDDPSLMMELVYDCFEAPEAGAVVKVREVIE